MKNVYMYAVLPIRYQVNAEFIRIILEYGEFKTMVNSALTWDVRQLSSYGNSQLEIRVFIQFRVRNFRQPVIIHIYHIGILYGTPCNIYFLESADIGCRKLCASVKMVTPTTKKIFQHRKALDCETYSFFFGLFIFSQII